MRDARKHASPNAGYPEAAMAGALGLALGGPALLWRRPGRGCVDRRWALRRPTAADIRAALALYVRADAILIGAVALLAALIWIT